MTKQNSCVFCQILHHETKDFTVFEDKNSFAILDKRPIFPGHTLLIPKEHFYTIIELPDTLISPLFINAKRLAKAIEKAMAAEGTFIAINNKVSQSVPHLHIHIVPRQKKDGLKGFFWPRHPYRNEEHKREIQEKIKNALEEEQS